MGSVHRWRCVVICMFGALASLAGGCGGGDKTPQPDVESRLQAISVSYGQATAQNQGKPPKDEAAFRAILKQRPPNWLTDMHVPSLDELFISPRDQQPFVIKYGIAPGMPGVGEVKLLAHEQTGVSGKRYVLKSNGAFEEVDDSRFAELTK